MTTITINWRELSLTAKGHACAGNFGEDIVCAGISALTQAQAPGTIVTSIPLSQAIRTRTSPGSEIAGMPASVTTAMFFPAAA